MTGGLDAAESAWTTVLSDVEAEARRLLSAADEIDTGESARAIYVHIRGAAEDLVVALARLDQASARLAQYPDYAPPVSA
jgi:hypothetical protein